MNHQTATKQQLRCQLFYLILAVMLVKCLHPSIHIKRKRTGSVFLRSKVLSQARVTTAWRLWYRLKTSCNFWSCVQKMILILLSGLRRRPISTFHMTSKMSSWKLWHCQCYGTYHVPSSLPSTPSCAMSAWMPPTRNSWSSAFAIGNSDLEVHEDVIQLLTFPLQPLSKSSRFG